MNRPKALVSDFDGTISETDAFYLLRPYFVDQDLTPWQEYLSGHRSHLNALQEMFSRLRLPEAELLKIIDTIKWDHSFLKVAAYCQEMKIPLYICSAGCDYYIQRLVSKYLQEYNITLVSNHGVYDQQTGLKLVPPSEDSPYYDAEVGISKAAIVNSLQQQGYEVIYAGDGPPDFSPAQIADVVFAKKNLLEKCQEAGIATQAFETFDNVLTYLENN